MKIKKLKWLIVNASLIVISAICFIVSSALSGGLESQKAAPRWQGEGDMSFEQLTCFMSETDTLALSDIYTFRQSLDTKLTEASVDNENAGGTLYIDAWSAGGKQTVYADRGNGEFSVIAVGGDYFFFHPLRLLSGGYISESDLMEDRVVLDRETAWRLFGGIELEGLTVRIGDKPFVIAGVVDREDDFASKKAYTGGAGIYMSYEAFNAITESPVECYEIVMPQLVDGFAEDILKNTFKIGAGEILNNSGRFRFDSLWGIIKDFGTRSMHTTSVIYPYWENAARCLGDWCALLLLLGMLFAVFPAVFIFVMLMLFLIKGKDYLEENLPEWTSNALDRGRKKRYARHGAHEKRRGAHLPPAAAPASLPERSAEEQEREREEAGTHM